MRASLLLSSWKVALGAAAVVATTGCISQRGLADDKDISEVLCEKNHYFLDEDGDSWGDPNSTPEWACEDDREQGELYTARNNRDCDDGSEDVTGRVGVCPSGLADTGGYTQSSLDASEYLVVRRDTSVSTDQALTACDDWAFTPEASGSGVALVTFETEGEAADIVGGLAAEDQGYEFFLSLHWTDDDWRWPDGSGAALGTDTLPFCGGARPQGYDGQHLALIYEEGVWCLGETAATFFGAFICERPKPNFDDFEYYASVVEGSDETGE